MSILIIHNYSVLQNVRYGGSMLAMKKSLVLIGGSHGHDFDAAADANADAEMKIESYKPGGLWKDEEFSFFYPHHCALLMAGESDGAWMNGGHAKLGSNGWRYGM